MSSSSTKRLIVVLNDNEWSIAKNVRCDPSSYLNRLSTSPTYNKLQNHDVEAFFQELPGRRGDEPRPINKWKRETKDLSSSSSSAVREIPRLPLYLGPGRRPQTSNAPGEEPRVQPAPLRRARDHPCADEEGQGPRGAAVQLPRKKFHGPQVRSRTRSPGRAREGRTRVRRPITRTSSARPSCASRRRTRASSAITGAMAERQNRPLPTLAGGSAPGSFFRRRQSAEGARPCLFAAGHGRGSKSP